MAQKTRNAFRTQEAQGEDLKRELKEITGGTLNLMFTLNEDLKRELKASREPVDLCEFRPLKKISKEN